MFLSELPQKMFICINFVAFIMSKCIFVYKSSTKEASKSWWSLPQRVSGFIFYHNDETKTCFRNNTHGASLLTLYSHE